MAACQQNQNVCDGPNLENSKFILTLHIFFAYLQLLFPTITFFTRLNLFLKLVSSAKIWHFKVFFGGICAWRFFWSTWRTMFQNLILLFLVSLKGQKSHLNEGGARGAESDQHRSAPITLSRCDKLNDRGALKGLNKKNALKFVKKSVGKAWKA